ncbi:MAG: alpha-amylase family glycosyl hydrolase [Gammaproteobacteria bacterium]
MALISVNFEYRTGLRTPFILNARLGGNWDASGRLAESWSFAPMQPFTADDGCPAFRATVELDDSQIGQTFRWGVSVDTAAEPNRWGIATEVNEAGSRARERVFTLQGADQTERYYLTHCRYLGANKRYVEGQTEPAIWFALWAPNARQVELVFGDRESGYIYNDDRGINEQLPRVTMTREANGVWSAEGATTPALARFTPFDHQPYMFRITKDDGSVAYRTDLYSRCQIGSGHVNPESPPAPPGEPSPAPWSGRRQDLDGTKSCSVVIDPEQVTELFDECQQNGQPLECRESGEPVWPETRWLSEDDFWQDEFPPDRTLPTRLEDLVIYELHIDGLGLDRGAPRGTLEDAMRLIPYLRDLGINAVGLMPMAEFQGGWGWGYSTSHYMAVEYAGGGRDKFKHFIRECHRNGIAVILDVVYNHYTFDAERAEWAYDSNTPERNIYYWYEGRTSDYAHPNGGYVNNGSSGWAPRYWEEWVRKMFTSSAAALISEFHFDGFRVDLTQAIHRDNTLNVAAPAPSVPSANLFGQKLLREWANTIHLIRPSALLIAEDHSGWPGVTQPTGEGGLGFDATWYADFYHHLIGDAQDNPGRARLLREAGYGDNRSLAMAWFGQVLASSNNHYVVYHESHDEAGNAPGSARTIAVAVNYVPLVDGTRRYAEARVHFAAGMTLLAPATPMFFMGEEVGASLAYTYGDFLNAREDFLALRQGVAAALFRFYADLIRLRLAHPALRSRSFEVLQTHDANRILSFRRWAVSEEMLVIGSLNNAAFGAGYRLLDSRIADGEWREVFNSDADAYGGGGLLNPGTILSSGGVITVNVPANSVVVLRRQ